MVAELDRYVVDRHEAIKEWKERSGKKVFGYLCCVVPEAMLYAADVLPVRIFGSAEKFEKVEGHLVPYGCRYVGSCLDLAARGIYDYLDGVIIPNTCDLISRIEYWWKELVPRKVPTIAGVEVCPYVLFINYPMKKNASKVLDYYQWELKWLKQSLERGLRREISDESLRTAIAVYNEHFELMRQLDDLRKRSPLAISGHEAWQIEYSSLLMPKDQHNAFLKSFLAQASKKNGGAPGVRLFLSGSAMDQVNARLYEIIQESGGQVVSEDITCGTSYYGTDIPTDGDPVEALARHSLHLDCPRTTVTCSAKASPPYPTSRWEFLQSNIKGYGVQGAIFYVMNYCECRAVEYPHLRDKIQQEFDIPVLHLEGDYTVEGLEQMRGRIEAFVEMIGG